MPATGSPVEAFFAQGVLTTYKFYERALTGLISTAAEPTFLAIDTLAAATGTDLTQDFGRSQLSGTLQTFNSDPNASAIQNIGTGVKGVFNAAIGDTFTSGAQFIQNPTLVNARAFGDNLLDTSAGILTGRFLTKFRGNAPVRGAEVFADQAAEILENSARSRGLNRNAGVVAVKQAQEVELSRLRFPASRPFADPGKLARHGKFDLNKFTPIIVKRLKSGVLEIEDGVTRVENALRSNIKKLQAFIFDE